MATDPFHTPAVPTGRDVLKRPSPDPTSASAERLKPAAPDTQGPPPAPEGEAGEKVRISKAAQELLRQSELMERARQNLEGESDVRSERVQEVKERLRAGVYDTKAVRDELAHRLTSILGDLPYRGSGRSEG